MLMAARSESPASSDVVQSFILFCRCRFRRGSAGKTAIKRKTLPAATDLAQHAEIRHISHTSTVQNSAGRDHQTLTIVDTVEVLGFESPHAYHSLSVSWREFPVYAEGTKGTNWVQAILPRRILNCSAK